VKQYLVFKGQMHYPIGGVADFEGSYETIQEARSAASSVGEFQWAQVSTKDMVAVVSFVNFGDDEGVREYKGLW